MALTINIPTQVTQTITSGVTAYAPSENAVFVALALKADLSALTSYVPYTGATGDVNLGNNNLSSKAITISGTAGNGHLHLKHQSVDATATGSSTALFADVNGDLKYKNDGSYYTTLITSGNTADRNYTFPNASGTVALTSDLSAYQTLLVSGTNIKTINGTSVLGSGNISISSGLTVGTTSITSGTNTRILYNNSGIVGEYTLTGTGTVVAMQTSPSFLTSTTTTLTDAVTNAATTVQTLVHNSSGSIAANFGLSTLIQLQSTTTASRDAGKESWSWETATDATRSSRYSLSLVSAGGALTEYYRFGATGIVEMYGSAPQFQFTPGGTLRTIISWVNPALRISAQESPFSQILVYKDKVAINNDGSGLNKLGINTTGPTTQLEIAAGTKGVGQLKLNAGVAPTGAALTDGCIWFDGTDFNARVGGVTKIISLI